MELVLGTNSGMSVSVDNDNSTNNHTVLVGASGSGKTVMAQKLICQAVTQGTTVIAFDFHHTMTDDQIFRECKNTINRYRHDINALDGIPIDLLTNKPSEEVGTDTDINTIGSVTDIFCNHFGFGVKQRAALRRALKYIMPSDSDERHLDYERDGIFALKGALQEENTSEATGVYERLYYIIENNIFQSEKRVNGQMIIDGRINIVHLNDLDTKTQIDVVDIILEVIWRRALTGAYIDKGLYVFVDECQNISDGKNAVLPKFLSEGRKLGVSLLLATQMILQSSTSALYQRITQAGLILVFKPPANKYIQAAKLIDPQAGEKWISCLKQIKIGCCVANGNFLIEGRSVNYPIEINGITTTNSKPSISRNASKPLTALYTPKK